ncbi:MAG: chemotaxis protein CheX [Polyangiaceae bacterium]
MTPDRQVLVVGGADDPLAQVMEELDRLGFRVVWVPTPLAAVDFIAVSPRLSLVVVSAAAAGAGGKEFLAGVKEMRPSLRIIWGMRADMPHIRKRRPTLDSVIPEPIQPETLRETVSTLLAECFYPNSIASAIKGAALEILGRLGDFRIEGDFFLVPKQSNLSEFSALILFKGEASGHLMLSMSGVDASALYRRMLPGTAVISVDRLEDLVGELCSQMIGRINAFFAQYSIAVQHTTPIFVRSAGNSVYYAGRHPSFGVELSSGPASVLLEYYLADFDKSKLLIGAEEQVMSPGEVRFL